MRFSLSTIVIGLVACVEVSDGKDESIADNSEPEVIDQDGDGIGANEGDCDDSNADINPNAVEVCDAIDNNCNGLIDDGMLQWSWQDDAVRWQVVEGVTQVSIDIDDQGWEAGDHVADGLPDERHIISFNEAGKRTRYEVDGSIDGNIDLRIDYTYDESGNLLTESFDSGADGGLEKQITYTYDSASNLLFIETDTDGDAQPNQVESYTYDDAGRLIAQELDSDMDGVVDSGEYKEYNEVGLLVSSESREGEQVLSREQRTYDESGNLLYIDRDNPQDDDDALDSRHFHSRSSNLLVIESDQDMDGQIDLIVTHRYDAEGRLMKTERDVNLDGVGDSILSLDYDDYGLTEVESSDEINGVGESTSILSGENKTYLQEQIINLDYFEAVFRHQFQVSCAQAPTE